MSQSRIETIVADDDPAMREALADLIESHPDLLLVGLAGDHERTIEAAAELRPNVVVMDVRMPKGEAAGSIEAIRECSPETRVVVLTSYEDRETVLETVTAGATGYVIKGAPAEEIVDAVTRAARGQFSMAAELAADCFFAAGQGGAVGRNSEEVLRRRIEESGLGLLGRALCGALVVGSTGGIEFANGAAARIFGYTATELRHKRFADLVPRKSRISAEHLLRGPFTAPSEITMTRRDGTEFPALLSTGPLQGRPRRTVYVMDRTETRAAENRFRQLVASSPDAIAVMDSAGQILQANAKVGTLFGYSDEELVGQPIEMLLPDLPLVTPPGSGFDQGELVGRSLEIVGHRSEGQQFPADVSVTPVQTEQGPLAVLIIRDITEVQRAQFVLERSLELLESTDRDRQVLLDHLVRAQEQERGRIAAGIHDDTIQVITAANLRLQQLRRKLSRNDELQALDKLGEALKLSLSRLRQLIFDLRPTGLEYGSLTGALREYLEQIRAETGTVYRLEDRLAAKPPVETAVLMYRAAQEALMNVRKHAQADTVRVQLLGLDDGCLVRIVDDGIGYNPVEVESHPGHLGLTLMQERAQIAGGWCRIESAPGAGTTVEFWVPLSEPGTCDVAERDGAQVLESPKAE